MLPGVTKCYQVLLGVARVTELTTPPRCDDGYEFDLYEVEERYLSDDHTQAILTCIQGETYDPPIYPIPNCYEGEY